MDKTIESALELSKMNLICKFLFANNKFVFGW